MKNALNPLKGIALWASLMATGSTLSQIPSNQQLGDVAGEAINLPIAQTQYSQRDVMDRQAIHLVRVAYEPNSLSPVTAIFKPVYNMVL